MATGRRWLARWLAAGIALAALWLPAMPAAPAPRGGPLAQVAPPPLPPTPPPAPRPPATPPAPAGQPVMPGIPAPPALVQELQALLGQAVQRFEARDLGGVLGHVSEQYRTGPLTKPAIRGQLATMFQVYEALRARVRIDEVRMVGEQAWVYSTGEVTGRLPFVGQWMTVLAWERELEIARREDGGAWRLFGYQQ